MIKKIFYVFFAVLICVSVLSIYSFADQMINVSLTNRELIFGQKTEMKIEIDSSIAGSFKLPNMPDFIVVQKKNYKKGNKQIYVYELAPKKEGFIDIPAIQIDGFSSESVSIRVSEPKVQKKQSYSKGDKNVSVTAYADVQAVYVNQPVYYTLRFASRLELASNPNYTLPMFKDFWKTKSNTKSGYRLIDGENYFVFEVTNRIYPMRDGDITIDPSTVSVVVSAMGKNVKRDLQTKPVTIKVFPLPASGRPENFSGAVGKYSITASLSKREVVINEPIYLNILIKGNGNINSVIEPEIALPEDIQKYATTYKTNSKGISNSRSFRCVLIPLTEGKKYIPEIPFSYFDPDYKEYITIKTDRLVVNVKEGLYVSDEKIVDNSEEENTGAELKEIKDIVKSEDISLSQYSNAYIKDSIVFKSFIFILIVFFIFALVYRIKIIIFERDRLKVERQNALNSATEHLKTAENMIVTADKEKFYFNIDIALRKYIQSKNNCDYTVMLKEDINKDLIKRKINIEVADNINKVFIDCEFFKFTQAQSTADYMTQTLNEVKNIMKQLDEFYEKTN